MPINKTKEALINKQIGETGVTWHMGISEETVILGNMKSPVIFPVSSLYQPAKIS